MHQAFEEKPLGSVLHFLNGKSIKPGGLGIYPVYGSNGIIGCSDEFCFENGVIIGRVGAYCGSIAYCPSRFWASDNTIVAMPKDATADVRFYAYLLKYLELNNYAGGAAQPLVTQTVLKKVAASIPNPQLQSRIAAILSTYDDFIENNTRRIQILEEMAQRIYEEWFVHFRFPGHENVRIIETAQESLPENWSVKSVADFGKVVTGKTPSKRDSKNFGLDVPFLKLPDMHGRIFCIDTSEKLSNEGASSQSSKFIPLNSLCVSCIGTAGVVNISAVECQTNQQINSLIPNETHNREYLYFALLGLREQINQYGANGATMVNLNKGKFESLPMIYPQEEILKSYHNVTDPLFEQMLNLQRRNSALRTTRDLLLPKLISGEINVSNFPEPVSH